MMKVMLNEKWRLNPKQAIPFGVKAFDKLNMACCIKNTGIHEFFHVNCTALERSDINVDQITEAMEAIPYFYESVDRNAIVVKPKRLLFDWVNKHYPESPVDPEDVEEATVYLVKERDSNEELEAWLKRNFDAIFQNELNNWHTDEADWPKKRTFKQFQEWFEYSFHSMVLDIEDGPIKKY